MLGAEGPKNVALAAEICDGWLPIFYTPRLADMYNEWLDEGSPGRRAAQPGGLRDLRDGQVVITDDRSAAFEGIKPFLALYMGGMGAEDTNFHADVYRRMGYAEVVDEVTALFRSNRKEQAAKVIPDELVDDAAIVGDIDYVRKQITVWEAAGVTMMVVTAGTPSRCANSPRSSDQRLVGLERVLDWPDDSLAAHHCRHGAHDAGEDPQGQSAHGDVLSGRRRRPADGSTTAAWRSAGTYPVARS